MPQFELSNFLPQLFWLAIFFAILYFAVVRPTLPKLGRVMDARETQVTGDLDTAAKAKAEADRMATEYDEGVATAQNDARTRIVEAQSRAARHLEGKLAESNAAIHARTDAAEANIAAARKQAMGEIETVAAEAAGDIVEKLTGARPDPTRTQDAARAALV
ncbi:MAG: ATPase [Sphingomonas bacterium]|nr:ATPase [Sphingomonas bacterium]